MEYMLKNAPIQEVTTKLAQHLSMDSRVVLNYAKQWLNPMMIKQTSSAETFVSDLFQKIMFAPIDLQVFFPSTKITNIYIYVFGEQKHSALAISAIGDARQNYVILTALARLVSQGRSAPGRMAFTEFTQTPSNAQSTYARFMLNNIFDAYFCRPAILSLCMAHIYSTSVHAGALKLNGVENVIQISEIVRLMLLGALRQICARIVATPHPASRDIDELQQICSSSETFRCQSFAQLFLEQCKRTRVSEFPSKSN